MSKAWPFDLPPVSKVEGDPSCPCIDQLPECTAYLRTDQKSVSEVSGADRSVVVARAARAMRFPSRFALVAASNPCPCGYAGCEDRPCRCSVADLERHRTRLSGPLADRIDLHVHVQRVSPAALADHGAHTPAERSATVRERVLCARERQRVRYAHTTTVHAGPHATIAGLNNASAPTRLIAPAARLEPAARALLVRAADKLSLSARSYHRVLRVARTIADLDDLEVVTSAHIGEALRFRPVEDALHASGGQGSAPAIHSE